MYREKVSSLAQKACTQYGFSVVSFLACFSFISEDSEFAMKLVCLIGMPWAGFPVVKKIQPIYDSSLPRNALHVSSVSLKMVERR